MYNRGWRGSGGYPPTSQPFDQYQVGVFSILFVLCDFCSFCLFFNQVCLTERWNGPWKRPTTWGSGPLGPPGGMLPHGPRMMMRSSQQMQVAVGFNDLNFKVLNTK